MDYEEEKSEYICKKSEGGSGKDQMNNIKKAQSHVYRDLAAVERVIQEVETETNFM